MCRTSAPPRRDLYELTQSLSTVPTKSATADNGGFLLPGQRPRIRIGACSEARRAHVYNADYLTDGTRYASYEKPWTAFTAIDFRAFKTHHEALTWALQEAHK